MTNAEEEQNPIDLFQLKTNMHGCLLILLQILTFQGEKAFDT